EAERASLWIGKTEYHYDQGINGAGRLIGVDQYRTMADTTASDVPTLHAVYTYDGQGRVWKETRTFNATGVAADSLVQSVDRTYNALGALTNSTWDDGQTVSTTYDARGLPQQVAYAGGGLSSQIVADYGIRSKAGAPTKRSTGTSFGEQ